MNSTTILLKIILKNDIIKPTQLRRFSDQVQYHTEKMWEKDYKDEPT